MIYVKYHKHQTKLGGGGILFWIELIDFCTVVSYIIVAPLFFSLYHKHTVLRDYTTFGHNLNRLCPQEN